MNDLVNLLARLGDLGLVVLGFTLIIVLHELGHFLAARWAGIRVLAFAVGFGPALCSYRRGLGWRRGSTEAEYRKVPPASSQPGATGPAVSPTEYRLNMLPFGGYVKMLGQDDMDPASRSNEPDSYQSCPPWRRMIVISAGVVANIITAAILFVVVFMVGLRTEPPKVGAVEPGSPAATTIASNGPALGVTDPGLRRGDEIALIDGDRPQSFDEVRLAATMARPGSTIAVDVRRAGVEGPLHFAIRPVVGPDTRMLQIGIGAAASSQIGDARGSARAAIQQYFARRGLEGLEPGMTLKTLDGRPVGNAYDLTEAAEKAAGQPLHALFTTKDGREVPLDLPTRPSLMTDQFMVDGAETREARHLLGVMPVLAVDDVVAGDYGDQIGLKPGDVFARLGGVEWPSVPTGVAEIRANKGGRVHILVERRDEAGRWMEKDLGEARVSGGGTIGFTLGDSSARGPWVGTAFSKSSLPASPPSLTPGSRIVSVNGHPTATLLEVSARLREMARAAAPAPNSPANLEVPLVVERPLQTSNGSTPTDEVAWSIPPESARQLTSTGWESVLDPSMFEPERFDLRASSPVAAIRMGLRETKRVMLSTYVTFVRLFQGSVKVEHLKGPVGIAHVGTVLAERGLIWLMFFMALISVNLAVINFLPLPIVDGGHFLFLLYEQFTGKPVSAAVQNVAAIAGLLLIGTLFLVVTFHDLSNLFRG